MDKVQINIDTVIEKDAGTGLFYLVHIDKNGETLGTNHISYQSFEEALDDYNQQNNRWR